MTSCQNTQEGPRRATVQAALARRQQEIRTLATLQSHLTTDITCLVLDILKGTDTKHELPLKEGPSRSFVRKGRRTSGYRGAYTKDGNKWTAQIQRGGVKTQLGAYDEELTAAIVFQVVDSKLGFPSRRNLKPTSCTNRQPAKPLHADSTAQGTCTCDVGQAQYISPGDLGLEPTSPRRSSDLEEGHPRALEHRK